MLDPATQAEVLRLYFTEKVSQRRIAFRMGIHRQTVAALIQRQSVRMERSPETRCPSMLEPY